MNDAQTYDQFVTRYAAQREKTLICLFLGEFATIFDNILGEYQGPRWDYLMKKKLEVENLLTLFLSGDSTIRLENGLMILAQSWYFLN
jgi:hypothetical protein